jgi:serine/threonine protein kinase
MLTVSDFLDELRKWRLLEPTQLEELCREFQGRTIGARTLACELIERGWLTPFQASRLHQGRGDELFLGSYVLLDRLGEGGMGAVFKARDGRLDRVVAVKVLREGRMGDADSIRRFRREIRAATLLRHPNIVRALTSEEVNSSQLLVMEYVEGIDLGKLVGEKGPLPPRKAADCVRQTALALAHAHEKGMVHRDIKPSNLLLTREGQIKLLDLGLARLLPGADGAGSSTLTESGFIMGTLDYLAPEQARRSHDVDIRADLYSLGCTFYFLLTGRVPFPGGTVAEKLVKHQLDEPAPVEQLCTDVPPGLAAVVRKLMAKNPEQRYQTPVEVVEVLSKGVEPISSSLVAAATSQNTVRNGISAADPDMTASYHPVRQQPAPRRRGSTFLLAAGMVVLAALLLAAFLAMGSLRPRTESKPSTPKSWPPSTALIR